jgi:hypothetical protein
MSHMKCRNCGDEQLDTEVYCSNCGHALNPQEHVGGQQHVHRSTKAEYTTKSPAQLAKVVVPAIIVLLVVILSVRHAHKTAGERALLDAARAGDQARLEEVLDQGVSASARDEDGKTALHLVLTAAQQPEASRLAALNVLLAKGADANVKDAQGVTPLHLAAAAGEAALVEALMSHGANVNVEDASHRTPLMAARKGLEATAQKYGINATDPSALLIVQGSVPELHAYVRTVELLQKHDKNELRSRPSATTTGEVAGQ